MTDEYVKARKAGEKEYKARSAAGRYPFLPALDEIVPDSELMRRQEMGLIEIPVRLIAGTKTRARQNAFAANFMPLLEPESEFGAKWSSLYNAQLEEGFSDPIKAYEYLHRFYVQEGNKRVSVSRYLGMPTISASVVRLVPDDRTLAEHPEYAEFMRFYSVCPVYDLETSWAGSYTEIAELVGMDLEKPWPEELVRSLRNTYWNFLKAMESLEGRIPEMLPGDAFMVYLRIYIRDALGRHSEDVIQKRILRIKKELLTEHNTDRIALVESSDEALSAGSLIEKTGTAVTSAVTKVIPALSYSPKHPLKAAFIYNKSIAESSWVADHEEGRLRLERAYGGTVKTMCFESCGSSEKFEEAVGKAARWGAEVVFTTSPAQIHDALRAAIKYGEIRFLNCSVNLSHQAVRTYYAKIYEAKFLAGLVAGTYAASTGSHLIGYRSDYPIYGTIAGINAFAIGAAMADPEAKIYLEWSTKRDANWWWEMVDRELHVISAVDSLHSPDGSDAYGVCCVERCKPGEGNDLSGTCRIKHLAAPIWKWGKLYEIIIKSVIEGTYNTHLVDRKDQATNYWWGMISGVVDIELADDISPYTRQLVGILRRDIIDGRFNPFDGELRSQDGLVRKAGDAPLSSRDIIMMDWLNENIIGEIPVIDALVDDAKSTVKLSGVEKTRKR